MRKYVFLLVIGLAAALVFAPLASALPEEKVMGQAISTASQRLPLRQLPAGTAAAAQASTDKVLPTKRPPAPDPEPAANKWAVVIGIADYQGTANDLWHPDEDAAEMAKALTANAGFASDHVKILLNKKATAAAISSAIDWLATNENSQSTVVFFYSGHGFRAADAEGWDGDSESDGYDEGIVSYDMYGLPDGYLKQKFTSLESQKVALCFASCHSGGMFDDGDDMQAENRVIAAACKADQYGWDYQLLGNTLFGKYFVDEALLLKKADLNGDGVSIEEALAYAYPRVIAQQADSQPQLSARFVGEFVP